jgi:hypothetical protein
MEENPINEAFVRFRFASVAITTFDTECAAAKWRLSYCEMEQMSGCGFFYVTEAQFMVV